MITEEIKKLKVILDLILGESKQELDNSMQLEYPCPHCVEKYGFQEIRKYNLSLSLSKNLFQCWKCSSENDDEMRGSIVKLIRMYGNDKLLQEYKDIIRSIRESDLYKLHFNDGDFNIDTSVIEKEELKFPSTFKLFNKNEKNHYGALKYLQDRGLGWDIIERFKIGYTLREEDDKMKKYSYRVIIPSYNSMGELNYWVGRDYLPKNPKFERTKYSNPKAEKKEIIFNEDRIQWDADITLVEGAFDHIVVPNSIPLLGKALDKDYKLYWDIITKANANINIFLDNDIENNGKKIYSLLNHGRLYNKIRYIYTDLGKDPSEIYEKYGYKGIINSLKLAKKIPEYEIFY